MAPTQPYFRASLRPFADSWSGGPGMSCPIVRFGLWASLPQVAPDGVADLPRIGRVALLTPEAAYSVLPFSARQAPPVACDLTVPPLWQGQPVPRWRGVPCQIGTVDLFLPDDLQGGATSPFPLQVLLPERDPPGPPSDSLFLGEQFLRHYALRVTIDYPAIRYTADPISGRRRLDSAVSCGLLEAW